MLTAYSSQLTDLRTAACGTDGSDLITTVGLLPLLRRGWRRRKKRRLVHHRRRRRYRRRWLVVVAKPAAVVIVVVIHPRGVATTSRSWSTTINTSTPNEYWWTGEGIRY